MDELMSIYHDLPKEKKESHIIEELKLIAALLELLCDQKHIKYNKVVIDDNFVGEDECLDIIYKYITYLKENLGRYVIDIERK